MTQPTSRSTARSHCIKQNQLLVNNRANETAMADQSKPVVSNPRHSLVFAAVKICCILTTCPCFDNREFDIFDACGLQCNFVTVSVRIRTLKLHL